MRRQSGATNPDPPYSPEARGAGPQEELDDQLD